MGTSEIQVALYRKHEREVSLSLWDGWLYKRLAVLQGLTVGIAELPIGGAVPHCHKDEHVIHYVLDGSGTIEYDHNRTRTVPFEPGQIIEFQPHQHHTYFCDSSVLLLTTRALPSLLSKIIVETVMPGAEWGIDRTQTRSIAQECYFLVSGRLTVATARQTLSIDAQTAFCVDLAVSSFTIRNTDSKPAALLYACTIAAHEHANPKETQR